jgi:hypothetical protein
MRLGRLVFSVVGCFSRQLVLLLVLEGWVVVQKCEEWKKGLKIRGHENILRAGTWSDED